MEQLAIVAALQLAVNINSNITTKEIATDLLGCCQIVNRRKKQRQFTNNYIAVINTL